MKTTALCFVFVALLLVSPAKAAASADEEWTLIWDYAKAARDKMPRQDQSKEFVRYRDELRQKLTAMLFDFCEHYPSDPRRWDAIMRIRINRPTFVEGFKPEYDSSPVTANLIIDNKAKSAWERKANALSAELANADAPLPSGSTDEEYRSAIWADLYRLRWNGEGSFLEMRDRIARFAETFPKNSAAVSLAGQFAAAMRQLNPDVALEPMWARFASSPNEYLSTEARKQIGGGEIKLDRFVAVDGREVDLAKMRGKIVLVDFWSTVCGPCLAAFPELVRIYHKYHDHGFEVIGIALQEADEKAALLACVEKHRLPWPQYFDGKRWKTEPAVANNVSSTPTAYLIDQSGKIVAFGNLYVQLHPDAIEKKVRELLKLPALVTAPLKSE